jgi:NADH dehydrogenase
MQPLVIMMGSMATIRNKAVVIYLTIILVVFLRGLFGCLYTYFLGFKNKAVVFLNWVYNYIRFDREGTSDY